MNQVILNHINTFSEEAISAERKEILKPLADYIQFKINNHETIRLNFICTHNSRRSHLSQIWAQTIAYHFGIRYVYCYSGGTEATALFPKVAETLTNQGFQIHKLSESENPVYALKYDENDKLVFYHLQVVTNIAAPPQATCKCQRYWFQ